jgi:hypothetical protein
MRLRSGKTYSSKTSVTKKRTLAKKPMTAQTVRRIVLSTMETKKFSPNFTAFNASPWAANIFHCWNVMFHIPTGANDASKIGDQVYIQSLDLAFTVKHFGTISTFNQTTLCYIAVVWHNDRIHDGVTGPNSAGTTGVDYRVGGAGTFSHPIVDTDRVKVIWSRSFAVPNPDTNEPGRYTVRKTVPIKKMFQYEPGNTGYARDKNLMIYFAYTNPLNSNNLVANPQYVVNFKDA